MLSETAQDLSFKNQNDFPGAEKRSATNFRESGKIFCGTNEACMNGIARPVKSGSNQSCCLLLLRFFYLARFPSFDDFHCRVRVAVTVVKLNNLGKKLDFPPDEGEKARALRNSVKVCLIDTADLHLKCAQKPGLSQKDSVILSQWCLHQP